MSHGLLRAAHLQQLLCKQPAHLCQILLPPLLQVKRTNVAAMMAQQGFVEDVFAATQKYLKDRRRK